MKRRHILLLHGTALLPVRTGRLRPILGALFPAAAESASATAAADSGPAGKTGPPGCVRAG
eukprot:12024466-Prorocentrum_lima.AAC.1